MKKLIHLPFILLAMLIATSCNTAQKAFNQGRYHDATQHAVNRLRSKPNDTKALELVQRSYPMAIDYSRNLVERLSTSNDNDKYIKIANEYAVLNRLADEITRCPPALEVLRPVVYFHEQQKKAELMAMQEQYKNALSLLKTGSMYDAREALSRLEWIKQIQPNYEDIDRQIAIARDLATHKVVVEHLPDLKTNQVIDSRVFYVRLFDNIHRASGNEFTRFYRPELAEEIQLSPHDIVTVQFHEFNIGTMVERESTRSYEKDGVVLGKVTDSEGNEQEVKGSVKAEASIYGRELIARGILDISIIDYQSGEVLQTRKFPAEYIWKNEWATFNGDRRAVPAEVLKLVENKQLPPPNPQEMFLLWSEPIFQNSASFIRSHYTRRR